MKAFKAYDIRGVWETDLNPEIAYRIGNFIPYVFNVRKVLIGRDIRLSSPQLFESLCEGLTDAGVDVLDAGIATTPMIYWGTGKFNLEFSVMITASHNSKQYNGLKFSGKDVLPIGYDNGLNKLEELVDGSRATVKRRKGNIEKFDYYEAYLSFLKSYALDFSNLKISIDCSNGVSSIFTRKLFGDSPVYLNEEMDGTFPGHEPNPLEPENQIQIKNTVLENESDIGVIFDGDADRVMFIDEKGEFISPDLIIALLSDYFFGERKEKGRVVQDIRTSKAVGEYISKYGVEVDIWKVGRAFGATKLKEVDGVFGGELAGHYYFRDFYYSDSGMLAAILVLNIVSKLKKDGIAFSSAINSISTYANTGEVNFTIENKSEAMSEVISYFRTNEPGFRIFDFDGYRLEFDDWWFNIRPSNTEPYLRFLAEAKSADLLKHKTDIIYSILSRFQ